MASKTGRKEVLTQINMSLGFFFIFTAYQSLVNLQSSLNFEAGLGTISISVVYFGYLVSSLLIGSIVVHLITPKWTLFSAFFCHTVFIIANVFPLWSTMIPASLLLGIGSGPYWIAQGTYSTVLAVRYAGVSGQSLSQTTVKFSGIFHLLWGASRPLGNFITSIILSQDINEVNCSINTTGEIINTTYVNKMNISSLSSNELNNSYLVSSNGLSNSSLVSSNGLSNSSLANNSICNSSNMNFAFCGPNHCPYMEEHQQTLGKPDITLIYIMLAILLLFNIAGIVSTVFLDNVPSSKAGSIFKRISSIFSAFKDPNILLLIIPSCLVGIVPGTFFSSFAQSIVSCIFGIRMVGYTMVCEGTGFSVTSFLCGPLTKYIPRFYHVTLALTTFIALGVCFLFWFPQHFWVVCLVSVVYGSMHGILRTHISGLISLLFSRNPEAAFAHYNIWVGVGFSASFAYSNFLCYRVKMYIFIGVTVLATLTYCMLEMRIKRSREREKKLENNENIPVEEKTLEPLM